MYKLYYELFEKLKKDWFEIAVKKGSTKEEIKKNIAADPHGKELLHLLDVILSGRTAAFESQDEVNYFSTANVYMPSVNPMLAYINMDEDSVRRLLNKYGNENLILKYYDLKESDPEKCPSILYGYFIEDKIIYLLNDKFFNDYLLSDRDNTDKNPEKPPFSIVRLKIEDNAPFINKYQIIFNDNINNDLIAGFEISELVIPNIVIAARHIAGIKGTNSDKWENDEKWLNSNEDYIRLKEKYQKKKNPFGPVVLANDLQNEIRCDAIGRYLEEKGKKLTGNILFISKAMFLNDISTKNEVELYSQIPEILYFPERFYINTMEGLQVNDDQKLFEESFSSIGNILCFKTPTDEQIMQAVTNHPEEADYIENIQGFNENLFDIGVYERFEDYGIYFEETSYEKSSLI